ncbi:SsrA-binding protein SmpB [Candidatus Phytoplasma palmae]|uniref:SsrA-binding protein SmpB n=1 Tax=Candidatus Phytoplasma palmae TaxID=85624 RepID=UPI0039909B57
MHKTIFKNKKVFYNYFLDKKYLSGIQLFGNEVKSIRLGKVNLEHSYIQIEGSEIFILNMFIEKYIFCNFFDFDEKRKKKLLLKKKEILQIKNNIQKKGFSVVPTKILSVRNLLKLEIYLAKGKKKYDKRMSLRKKEDERRIKKTFF